MIESERLVMRPWRDEDVAPFQRICSDLEVMATLGPPLDLEATAARIGWMRAHEAEQGHCFWALDRREDARLIGWCGVIRGDMGPVADRVELGWRRARDCWRGGFSSAAGRGAAGWTFEKLSDGEIRRVVRKSVG